MRLLRSLRHPNVLQLRDMIVPQSLGPRGWKDVYLVTRLYDTNLHRVIYSGQPLTDAHVQYILWQVLMPGLCSFWSSRRKHGLLGFT